ncbi:MAG: LPS-assembly protein LptD [Treponema sp.]|jgi:hypothetical protein|nr:LPS-assembly protein LptD [Treponema sp.]
MPRPLFRLICFFLVLVFAGPGGLHSQGTNRGPPAGSGAAGGEGSGLSPEFVLERDIATSSFQELAEWCESLGLSPGGNREELAARLREYFKAPVPAPPAAEEDGGEEKRPLIITINSARTTEYFTVESVNEEYVRLRDGVSISLKDGEIVHHIDAGEILYNRTRKLMTASGGVVYVKEEGDKVETFKGDGITVNLDNWSTVFMRGISDHEISGGETKYRFAGEVISRSGEDSTVLRRAEITNANEDGAFWSINASKLWLLPGSDWGVLNAVIKVGEIPVLWLPAFYYPGNEVIFHPVFGVRAREGTFLQTTTYILGRPKPAASSEESSITAIMGSGEGMEKKMEGVFLRSTGRKVSGENEVKLSLMADAYANLGYYVGSDLSLPAKGKFGALSFSAGIAFSRDIALDRGNYTPFYPNYDGTSNWHRSNFFGNEVPFRYRFTADGSVSGSGKFARSAGLSWGLPLFSDPYIQNDFSRRSEDSNIFTLLRESSKLDTTIHSDYIDSQVWRLNGNISFVTTALEPFITDFSINSAAVSVSFAARHPSPSVNPADVPDPQLSYPPSTQFFYPDKFTLFSLSASIGGRPLSLGERGAAAAAAPEEAVIEGWGTAVSPWKEGEETAPSPGDPLDFKLPSLTRTVSAPVLGGHSFVMDYRITPSASSEFKFNSSKAGDPWNKAADIDWGDMAYQLYTFRADGNIGLTLSEKRNIYTSSLRFYGSSSWQDYTYLNETASEYDTPAEREYAKKQTHNMTYFTTSGEYDFTLRPFFWSEVWKETNFRYNLRGLLVKSRYNSTGDSWDILWGKWTQEDLEYHRVQANFSANVMDKTQNLSLTADVPPEESALTGDATVRVWISETNARSRIRKPLEDPYYEPVYFTETLKFFSNASLRHYMVYDPELSDFTSLTTSLSWGGFSAAFTATRSRGYVLEDDPNNLLNRPTGWYLDTGKEKLNPQTFSLGYQKSGTINEGGRITFNGGVNTGLSFDLQRYTYSSFYFNLNISATVNRFFQLTLGSTSRNTEIFRYFQGLPFYNDIDLDLPGEKNPLLDLINSFRFDDVEKRRASGFKLKSFNLDLTHYLGDWDATLGIKLTPELVTLGGGRRQYQFYTEVSFLVQWKPIKEFKTQMTYNKEGFSYE